MTRLSMPCTTSNPDSLFEYTATRCRSFRAPTSCDGESIRTSDTCAGEGGMGSERWGPRFSAKGQLDSTHDRLISDRKRVHFRTLASNSLMGNAASLLAPSVLRALASNVVRQTSNSRVAGLPTSTAVLPSSVARRCSKFSALEQSALGHKNGGRSGCFYSRCRLYPRQTREKTSGKSTWVFTDEQLVGP